MSYFRNSGSLFFEKLDIDNKFNLQKQEVKNTYENKLAKCYSNMSTCMNKCKTVQDYEKCYKEGTIILASLYAQHPNTNTSKK